LPYGLIGFGLTLDKPFHQIFQIGFLWRGWWRLVLRRGLVLESERIEMILGRMVRRRIWSFVGKF